METVTAGGVLLLVLSGTLVGVLFSLAACAGHSIANSALMHAVWNLVMVTDLLHITTEQGAYGRPIFSIILPSDAPLLTGAGFVAFIVRMIYRKVRRPKGPERQKEGLQNHV